MAALELVDPSNREFVGGDLLAQSLKHLGVTVAFGLHGGHLDAFLMGAHDAGINLVDTRHETVAVQAAEGYSKVKGEVGVCFVTANSGYVWQSASMRSTSCRQGVNSFSDSAMEYLVWLRLSQTVALCFVSPPLPRLAMPKQMSSRDFTTRSSWPGQ